MTGAAKASADRAPPEPVAEHLIDVLDVGKVFGAGRRSVEAISSISLTVTSGEFVSILGPSGCGKSTLLMMIGGLEQPSSGRISIGGRAVEGPQQDISMVFQDAALLPWKSVRDNVLFPLKILGKPVNAYETAANGLLERTGLGRFAGSLPRELSGGMRQRVALCRALVGNPDLLLMDEPFSALDAITRDDMNEVLMQLWTDQHKTAVFVTHSIREAVFLSDRVVVLGGRPSTVVADVAIPFARPRERSIGETVEFNRLCGRLRQYVEDGHRRTQLSQATA